MAKLQKSVRFDEDVWQMIEQLRSTSKRYRSYGDIINRILRPQLRQELIKKQRNK